MGATASINPVTPSRRSTVAVWFELPAADFERAVSFYEALFGTTLNRETIGPNRMAVFPYERERGISGCVMAGPGLAPADQGALVYLNADGALPDMLARVEKLGGRVAGPVIELPEGMGRFVHIVDTEGNRVGLHAVV
ncbi:VOC family protein [Alsobacter sp. R-9]